MKRTKRNHSIEARSTAGALLGMAGVVMLAAVTLWATPPTTPTTDSSTISVNGSGVVTAPTNFWSANAAAITNAIGGGGGGGGSYELPVATSSVLGGVMQGANVTIGTNGVISVAAPVTSLPFSSITSPPTTLAGYGITDPIVLTTGTYTNPAWLTSLAFSKLTGTPTSLAGYGIADPIVLTTGTYTNPAWIAGLSVSQGGTGATSFTADAPIFGGTTTTGPLQSGTVGTTGQVLTSNGPGTIPTFQTLSVPPTGEAWTRVISSGALSAGEYAWLDSHTGSSMTESLPTSPANGDTVVVADFMGSNSYAFGGNYGWATYPQTITSSSNIFYPGGLTNSIVLGVNYEVATFTYNSGYGWLESDSTSDIGGPYDAAGAGATAQTNAETFSAIGSNITSGTINIARLPAFTGGDATTTAGSGAITLGTVNSSPGTYTNATITVNAKGLATAVSSGSAGGTGTVTSVALAVPAIFSASGTPITTAGTLTIGLVNENANAVWAGPTSGSAAAPSFRPLVPADVPTLNQNTTGSAGSIGTGTYVPYLTGGVPSAATGTQLAGVLAFPSQSLPDAATTVTGTGNTLVVPSATPTAARVLTLPAAASVPSGKPIFVIDIGGFSAPDTTNTGSALGYTVTPSGTDTINGGASVYIGPGKYTYSMLFSDGVSKWCLATPNSVRAALGGANSFRPTISAPLDPSTGIGWLSTGTSSPNFTWIIGGSNDGTVSSSGINARIAPGSWNYSAAYASGGYTGNGLAVIITGGGGNSGLNYASGDSYLRLLRNGFSALSFYAPSSGQTASTTGYIGDIVTSGATTSFGIGKAPSIVGLDVTGAIQSDTALTLTGTGTATVPNLVVGGGTPLTGYLSATSSLSFGTITALSESTQTITVTGALLADDGAVKLGWSAGLPVGIIVKQAWVSSNNTVSITVTNVNTSTVTPSAITCRATVMQ